MMLRPLFVLIAALVITKAALAEEPVSDADIAGTWRMTTGLFDQRLCKISGDVTLFAEGPGTFTGDMRTMQACVGLDFSILAEQTLTARREGDRLIITATVISVEPEVSYLPDNFVLTVTSATEMTGQLRSAVNAPATFIRVEGAIA